MAPRRRFGRKIFKALLPITLLLVVAVLSVMAWVVHSATHPPRRAYLITPEKFRQLSNRGVKATDETWDNRDGTRARGWLLRGSEGAPAVVMLHRFGSDRSWLFNLGVKLNETTNVTILWPDLRGHGEDPPITFSAFGAREADDVLSAIDYLRSLRMAQEQPLVGNKIGLYGVEMGAYAALVATTSDPTVRALVLDSVPSSADELLNAAVKSRTGLDNFLINLLARGGTRIYFLGNYKNTPSCAAARSLADIKVLLLTGEEAGYLRDMTIGLGKCFPNPANVEIKSDLPLTGINAGSAPGQQGEAYDRHIIDFFDRTLLQQ